MKRSILLIPVLLLMSGCTSNDVQARELATYKSQDLKWTTCPKSYFVGDGESSKSFVKSRVTCSGLLVPATYRSQDDLPDFKIAMMRLSSASENKKGTLFINPGGPGASGIEELQWVPFPKAVTDVYDIVGFDPRGVSHSAPVTGKQIKCDDQSDFETYWKGEDTPSNMKEVRARQKISDAYMRKCMKANPNWWTLTTKNVVADLEIMRQVVTGDQPLNFLGSSYGTTIAASYITKYPSKIGHMILDSPTTNEPNSESGIVADARAQESQLNRLIRGYAKANNLSVGRVKEILLEIRQLGDDDKLVGFAGMKVVPGTENRVSTEYMFTHGIFALTYLDEETSQKYFNMGMDGLRSADRWNGIFEYFALDLDGYDTDSLGGPKYDPKKIKRDNSYEILSIVNSLDVDTRDNRSDEDYAALQEKIEEVSPFWTKLQEDPKDFEYTGEDDGLDWTSAAFSDPNIPNPSRVQPKRTNTSGSPVLVIGSRYESTTPYPFAVKTAKELKSPLVTFNGSVHAPLTGFDNACLTDIFVDYLIDDKLPAKSVSCNR